MGIDLYVGRTENEICPVSAVLAYLAIKGQDDRPLFKLSDGHPLSCQLLVQNLRSTLTTAEIDCKRYSGHSFSIGAATTVIARGVNESKVQSLAFIQIHRQELGQISKQLASNLES